MLKSSGPTAVYVIISSTTITVGITLWGYFDAYTYKIVTLFITLIILSNCLAKLFKLHVYNDSL